MAWPTWMRMPVLANTGRTGARSKRRGRSRWPRLTVEALEDRTLPQGTVTGSITVPGAQDTYACHLKTDTHLYFDSLTYDYNFNWTLTGPTGTLVNARPFSQSDSIDDYGNPVLNLVAGDYNLTVDGQGDHTGNFAFRLRDLADAVPMTPGTPVTGHLTPANETDFYRFDGTAGDKFYFDVQARSGADSARWRLVDPYGATVFENQFNSDTFYSDVETLALPRSGTYTVLLEGRVFDTSGANSAPYTFNVEPVVDPAPIALPLGDVANGTIASPGTQNTYTFHMANDSLLYFDSLTYNSRFNWTLTGPAGTAVSARPFSQSDSIDDYGYPILNLVAGDYTLTVNGVLDTTGDYSFRLSALAMATPLTPGTPVTGDLMPANETNLYNFTAAAGDQFFFDAQARSGADSARWRLVDSYGNTLFEHQFNSDLVNSSVGPVTLAQTGTYTLLLEGRIFDTTPGSYTFNVEFQGNTPPTAPTGTALTVGSKVTGTISTGGQQDTYLFTLADKSRLYFDSFTYNNGYGYYFNWTLTGPSGTVVNARPFSQSDSYDVANPVLDLPAGSYVLTVTTISGITGDYSFRLLDFAAATAITPGTPVSSDLTPTNETDMYRFTANAGDKYYFDVQERTGANYADWRLVDPYGNTLFLHQFNDTTYSDVDTQTLTQPGTYTLLLEGRVLDTYQSTASYTFNVTPVANPVPAPLTLGDTITDTLASPGQQNLYTFHLDANARLYFDSFTYSYSINWTLTGPSGTVVSERPIGGSDSYESYSANPVLALVAGDYTLTVHAPYGVTGDYSFRLLDLAAAVPITPGTPVSSDLTPTNETDMYRFTAAAGDKYYFDVQERTGANYADWRLVDPYGNILFLHQFNDTYYSDVDTMTLTQPGTYTLLLEGRVWDTYQSTASYTFNVTPIVDAPSVNVIIGNPQRVDVGAPPVLDEGSAFTLAPATFTDPETVVLATTATINWGDGSPTEVGVVDNTARTVSGGHTYADNGVYTVTVTIYNDDWGFTTGTEQVTVNNVNPTLTVVGDQKVNEGDLLSLPDIGLITDPGFRNPALGTDETFTYQINWGDGRPVDTGAARIDTVGSPGVLTAGSFDGSHTYADTGVYTVTVDVFDDDGGKDEKTFQVTVFNVPPTLTVIGDQKVNEGQLLSLTDIGTITDPGFRNIPGGTDETFTYQINWGDSRPLDTGTATIDRVGSPGVLTAGSFDGSHTYADNGTFTVTVDVFDDDGGMDEKTFQVTVNNVAPTLTVVGNQIIDQNDPLNLSPLGKITDPGFQNIPGGTDETFTYKVNWGDGSNVDTGSATITTVGSPGVLTEASFAGSHTYLNKGLYTVTVDVSDDDGGTDEKTFTVNVLATNGTVTSITQASPSPSTFGDPVTFTLSVDAPFFKGSQIPTGTLTLMEGSTTLGTSTSLQDVNGVATATFTTTSSQLTGGTHLIHAVYDGDSVFEGSTSEDISQTVNPHDTATTITGASPSPSTFGDAVTFTITVTPTIGGVLPTGTLAILEGTTTLGTSTALQDVNGVATATFTTTSTQLAGGTHLIHAVYSNDGNFDGSTSADFSQTVNAAATTTAITGASPSPSTFGDAVTFTITVTPTIGGVLPTGTLTVFDGNTMLGTSTALQDVGGVATATFITTSTQLAGGTHLIHALYSNDGNFDGSTSADFTQTVNAHATTTTITGASPSPSTFGDAVTFTITVTPTIGGVLPTGTLTIFDGTTALGTSTALQDVNGVATATFITTTTQLAGGTHLIHAVYHSSDGNFDTSTSADFSQTVNAAATTTTITGASPNPSTFGGAVTFTITVTPTIGGVLPTGTLTMFDGNTMLGTSTALQDVGGVATATFITTSTQLAGDTHLIHAVYHSSDGNFDTSTSADFSQTVNTAATTTTITGASPNPSTFGDAVTFKITVTPTIGGVLPTGTLTMFDGATTLGTSTALQDVGGVATATFITTSTQLAGGTHLIHAVYHSSDGNFGTSTSADFTQTVVQTSNSQTDFVTALYRDVLQRMPDPNGLKGWLDALQHGVSRLLVAKGFWESPEHFGLEVDSYYSTYLHRAADPVGRAGWVNALLHGFTETEVQVAFVLSPEYQLAHASADAYITALYADVLGRMPDAQGLAAWEPVALLPFGRSIIARGFLNSLEEHLRLVDGFYVTFLGRQADAQGEQGWLALLQAGVPFDFVAEAILGSPEYFTHVTGSPAP